MPLNVLRLALVQTQLYWEDPASNRSHFDELLAKSALNSDLVILPEMFSTGFSMRPDVIAETEDGPTLSWMIQKATSRSCAIAGSLAVRVGDLYFNRFYFVFPTGAYVFYDKRHLFTLAGEDKVYTAGQKQVIVDYLGWKLSLHICYD